MRLFMLGGIDCLAGLKSALVQAYSSHENISISRLKNSSTDSLVLSLAALKDGFENYHVRLSDDEYNVLFRILTEHFKSVTISNVLASIRVSNLIVIFIIKPFI